MEIAEEFFQKQEPDIRECLLALKQIILAVDPGISFSWKYGMPFFSVNNKMMCYLWVHKKQHLPYLGLVEGKHFDEAYLVQEKRARMKILLIDPHSELPLHRIQSLVEKAISLIRS